MEPRPARIIITRPREPKTRQPRLVVIIGRCSTRTRKREAMALLVTNNSVRTIKIALNNLQAVETTSATKTKQHKAKAEKVVTTISARIIRSVARTSIRMVTSTVLKVVMKNKRDKEVELQFKINLLNHHSSRRNMFRSSQSKMEKASNSNNSSNSNHNHNHNRSSTRPSKRKRMEVTTTSVVETRKAHSSRCTTRRSRTRAIRKTRQNKSSSPRVSKQQLLVAKTAKVIRQHRSRFCAQMSPYPEAVNSVSVPNKFCLN